jgi:hypothetical protein
MSRILSQVAIFLCLVVSGFSATYYVAPAGGTWQTVAQVNAQKFAAGDQVLFQRNGVWLERLTNASSGVTYSAYGSGMPPTLASFEIFDASDVTVDQLNFSNPPSNAKAFAFGHFRGGSNNHATYLTFSGLADRALYCQQSYGCVFQGNTVPDMKGEFGIVFFDSDGAKAYSNTVVGNAIGIATNASLQDMSECTDIQGNAVLYTDKTGGDGEAIEVTGNKSPFYTACATVHNNFIVGGPNTYGAIDAQDAVNSHVCNNMIVGTFTRYNMQWTTSNNILIENNVMGGAAANAFSFSSAQDGFAVTVRNNIASKQSQLAYPPAFIGTDGRVAVTQSGNAFIGPGKVCSNNCK